MREGRAALRQREEGGPGRRLWSRDPGGRGTGSLQSKRGLPQQVQGKGRGWGTPEPPQVQRPPLAQTQVHSTPRPCPPVRPPSYQEQEPPPGRARAPGLPRGPGDALWPQPLPPQGPFISLRVLGGGRGPAAARGSPTYDSALGGQ